MKILFVNPPVIRSANSKPENNFKVDGLVVSGFLGKIRGLTRIIRLANRIAGKEIRYGVRAGSRWPWTMSSPHGGPPYPFFMGYSAALLQANGFETDIFDAVVNKEYNYQRFLEKVVNAKSDIAVIECSTPTIDIDLWFAEKLANFTEVALAGHHLVQEAENLQRKNPCIRYLLKGEYILSSLKMAKTKRKGIYEPEVVKEIDAIPFPFRNFRGGECYYDPTMPTKRPQLQIYGSKGCPFKCTFCAWPQTMYFGNVSLRDPKKISEEIKEAVKLHGYKSIFFDDDTFNLGTDRIATLCDCLKKIGLPWTMMGRLDCSPVWLYDKMVVSGCVGMRFGIETFDLEILKKVKKGIEKKDFLAILKNITAKFPHVMIHLTMMKDMPGMTDEMHNHDMKILKELGYATNNIMRSYQLSQCVPFPGTEMYRELAGKYGAETLNEYRLYDGGQETVMKNIK
ncbi:MAG: radical SAM protein [Candidatus Omnitrophota bacterium]